MDDMQYYETKQHVLSVYFIRDFHDVINGETGRIMSHHRPHDICEQSGESFELVHKG